MKGLVEHHKFFIEQSRVFVTGSANSKYTSEDIIYYPVAYIKFMWYSRKEIFDLK